MKILFVMYELGNTYSPTSKIVYSIADQFINMGTEVHVLGPLNNGDTLAKMGEIIAHPFHTDADLRYNPKVQARFEQLRGKPLSTLRKILVLLRYPQAAFRLMFGGALKPYLVRLRQHYADQVLAMTETEHFDAIIGIYFPVSILQALGDIDLAPPLYLYQMDPWALHESPYPESPKKRMRQEMKAFQKARHIFTPPPLLKQYRQNEFREFVGKMTAVDFPNITTDIPNDPCPVLFPEKAFVILFTGSIADDYRSPAFFFEVFKHFLLHRPNAKMVFMGNAYSTLLKDFALKHPNWVTLIPPQDVHTARLAMKNADALLNIGNIFKYQVPSKLIDYLASGKPIINTCKMHDCPTLPYMAKYPLGLNLFEDEEPDIAADRLEAFCVRTQGKRVPFGEVKKLYPENTPEYVAKQMIDVIGRHNK